MRNFPSRQLWYDRPAGTNWNLGLPLGSGRLGAMIFGNVGRDRVQMNEDSVWTGGPSNRNNRDTLRLLPEVRRLIREGQLARAHTLAADALAGTPDVMRSYEPLADLIVAFDHGAKFNPNADVTAGAERAFEPGDYGVAYSSYRRWLDLATAIAGVEYTFEGTSYRREFFASAPDGVIAMRFTASRAGAISFNLRIDRGVLGNYAVSYVDAIVPIERRGLVLSGRAAGEGGVRIAAATAVSAEGGSVTTIGDTVVVSGADSCLIVVAGASSFREPDPGQVVLRTVNAATEKGWEALKAAHMAEYGAYYDRVALRLGVDGADSVDCMDKRIERARGGAEDPDLLALYFDYGRYLLIASSRPGSLPANSQGIWSQHYAAVWGCKWTININTEMNYWPAEVCNLADCHTPLFDLLERMAVNGAETARVMYGCRGFVAHHNADLWADAAPIDRNLAASYWLMGGAWLALHVWEHYAYSGDRAVLCRAWPIFREASRFFLDFLVPNQDGKLVVIPSLSPENKYRLPNGEVGTLCEGTTMDSAILDLLFRHTRETAEILGLEPEFR